MRLPKRLYPLFWDIDKERFDPAQWPAYTLSRILEFGDDAAVAWMRDSFTSDQIVQALRSDRNLSAKSANYWALVYEVPREQVIALQSPADGNPLA